jgi:hypothetical protein
MISISWQWIYNTGAIASNHYEVFLSFLLHSPWTANSPELNPILQFQSPWFLTLYSSVLIQSQIQTHSCYIEAAWTTQKTPPSVARIVVEVCYS